MVLVVLALLVEPFDPDLYCCDHLYYRGQAQSWSGLGAVNLSEIPLENRFWGVIANEETYYQLSNGLTAQPPYVFRPLVPLLAGLLGHLVGINVAFYLVTAISLLLLGYFSGLAVSKLSGSIGLGIAVAMGALLFPEVGRAFFYNYMLVDAASLAVVAAVLYLIVTRRWMAASIVAAIIAPLTKETLVTLALTVTIAAFLSGVRNRWLWVLPVFPILVQGALRISLNVPSPPPLNELFILGGQTRPAETMVAAFVGVSFLFYGLVSQRIRLTFVSFTPVIALLVVITSSSAADSPRIWLTIWPVVLVLGAVGLYMFLKVSPIRYLWMPLPILALVWMYIGSSIQSFNFIIYLAFAYGLILIPPILVGLQYLWIQNQLIQSDREKSSRSSSGAQI